MNISSILRVVFVLAAFVPLTGCNILGPISGKIRFVNTSPVPIAGPEGNASNQVYVAWDFVMEHEYFMWHAPGHTAEDEPISMKDTAQQVHDRVKRDAVHLGEVGTPSERIEYSNRVTIVCLNPIVALIEPDLFTIDADAEEGELHYLVHPKYTFLFQYSVGWYQLPYGIQAGRSIDTRDGVAWIDFTSFDTPQPIVTDGDGRAFLPVYWGRLELKPSGEGWTVRAIADPDKADLPAPPLLELQEPDPTGTDALDGTACVIPSGAEDLPSASNAP